MAQCGLLIAPAKGAVVGFFVAVRLTRLIVDVERKETMLL
jgi:hypothetical protein